MTIVPCGKDCFDLFVEFVEVHYHTNFIQFFTSYCHADYPIVSMEGLERSIVQFQLMCGGEGAAGGDLKVHGFILPFRRGR